jgi:hypothetical protein
MLPVLAVLPTPRSAPPRTGIAAAYTPLTSDAPTPYAPRGPPPAA